MYPKIRFFISLAEKVLAPIQLPVYDVGMNLFHKPLSQLLAPISPTDFASEFFAKKPLHLPNPGDPARFCEVFNWDSLNQLLNLSLSSDASPGLRIFRDSRNFIFKRAGENLQSMLKQLRLGSTLVLENIDKYDARLARLLDALSDEIAAETRINLYLSYPGTMGYPLHYDTHDFFILQVYGHKLWDIYPSTLPFPLFPSPAFQSPGEPVSAEYQPPPESSKLQQVLMSPGDVLYVPKGFWHKALAENEPSLHLTLGMYLKTGIDFLQWLVSELRDVAAFREPFPWVSKEALPEQLQAPSPYQPRMEQLQKGLLGLLSDPALISRFHQATYMSMPRRQAFFLPHQYARETEALAGYTRFRVVQIPYYLLEADGLLELSYAHQKLRFAPQARELLNFVLCSESFTRSSLEARFSMLSGSDILAVLLPLVQDGLLVPED